MKRKDDSRSTYAAALSPLKQNSNFVIVSGRFSIKRNIFG
jgi:hypothetical protein